MELAAGNREYGSTYAKSLEVLAQIRFFPPLLWFLGFLPGNKFFLRIRQGSQKGIRKKGQSNRESSQMHLVIINRIG